jgi:hypothetical protein
MDKKKFVEELRKRQIKLGLVSREFIDKLSEDEIIETYRICSACGAPLFELEELEFALKEGRTTDEVLDILYQPKKVCEVRVDTTQPLIIATIRQNKENLARRTWELVGNGIWVKCSCSKETLEDLIQPLHPPRIKDQLRSEVESFASEFNAKIHYFLDEHGAQLHSLWLDEEKIGLIRAMHLLTLAEGKKEIVPLDEILNTKIRKVSTDQLLKNKSSKRRYSLADKNH